MLFLKGSDEKEDIKNQIFEVYKIPKDLKKFFYQSKPFQFRYFKEITENALCPLILELKFSKEIKEIFKKIKRWWK